METLRLKKACYTTFSCFFYYWNIFLYKSWSILEWRVPHSWEFEDIHSSHISFKCIQVFYCSLVQHRTVYLLILELRTRALVYLFYNDIFNNIFIFNIHFLNPHTRCQMYVWVEAPLLSFKIRGVGSLVVKSVFDVR